MTYHEEAVVESPTATKPSVMKSVTISRLQELVANAVALRKQIKDAKTGVKKQYYTKKLRKNNQEAFQLMLAYERLQNK